MIVTVPFRNLFIRLKSPAESLKRNQALRRIFNKPEKTYYYQRYFSRDEISHLIKDAGFEIEALQPIDHVFSLVSFSGIFRDKNTYDGENQLAHAVADCLKKIMPWQSADSTLIVARKKAI